MTPSDPFPAPLTELLKRSQDGDTEAENQLFLAVFAQLRKIAVMHLRAKSDRNALEPTELVNEAYLHIFNGRAKDFQNRAHFFAVAARAMRCILLDMARRRNTARRNWGANEVTFAEDICVSGGEWSQTFLEFDQVLQRLAIFDPRASQIVELKVFMELTDDEIAQFIGLSSRQVKRDYKAARAWLKAELRSIDRSADNGQRKSAASQ